MDHDPVRRLFLLGMAAAGAGVGVTAAAADFPDRPIRMVVPYTPGGVADVFARLLGTIMAADLGQPFVIENKPGANTMVGAAAVAQAPADGYTVFQTTSTLMLNPLLYRRMPYDPKLLVPIAIGFEAPLVAVVSPRVPAKTMKAFVEYARSRPGQVNYASVGPGNVLHFVPELFKAQGGFEMTHIPYNGKSGEAFSSVLSGEVDFMSTVVAQALPSIQAGKLRALAVTSAERLPALPDVPTVAEAGFPDLRAATWYGLAVRSDTPQAVIARLVRAFDKALVDTDFRKRFSDQGMVMQQPRSAAEVDAFARGEVQRWAVLITDQKIVLD